MTEPWTYERARSFFDYEKAPKEWAERCDLCGQPGMGPDFPAGPGFTTVASVDRYGFPIQTERCLACGLEFQGLRLAPAGLRALYSGPYRALVSAWHGREINAQTLEPEQEAYGHRLAKIFEAEEVGGRRILDLGGSTGVVAYEVAWDIGLGREAVTVVEPGVAEAVAALRRSGRVVVQSAEDFEAEPGSFDLILLCQTVDHLRSISKVLAKVRTWLAPGGRFFVDAVDSSLIPEPERYKIDHIYSLTPRTLHAYLLKAGFFPRPVTAPSENHVAYLCEVA